VVLVVFSYMIRARLQESPLFAQLKASGKASSTPLRDSFLQPENRRLVILALLGATAGQGVVWYTGQFYALYYLQTVLKMDFVMANTLVALALLLGTPFFVVFGSLSDRVGRKKLMMLGCALAALLDYPIYRGLTAATQMPNLGGTVAIVALIWVQVLFVTLVYGPIAAFLVELFPTRIRYTSMSLPYHLGNGVFGGLVPFIGTALVASTGNPYAGLIYPITVAALTFVVGMLWLPDRAGVPLAG
jgi:MFS family permease